MVLFHATRWNNPGRWSVFTVAGGAKMQTPVQEIKSEINVTPLVDVVLVLLIIFMVVTPMMVSREVLLPETRNPGKQPPENQKMIYMTESGELFFEDTPMVAENLVARLQRIRIEEPNAQILLRADRRLTYAKVSGVLDLIAQGGFSQVGLISQPAMQH
jgi:biopolymer transport protein TolR